LRPLLLVSRLYPISPFHSLWFKIGGQVVLIWNLGKLKPDAMITKKVKLERVEEDGLKSMIKNVKILVDVHG
jgi:hypothetical protein